MANTFDIQAPSRAGTTAKDSTRGRPDDDVDDLFDYDAGMDEIFQAVDTNMDAAPQSNKSGANGTSAGKKRGATDLGIDETVKVRMRRTNVKLDYDRLVSEPGIPKLRRIAKEKLRFKGKGHEFSDVARLLATYQLWLDDLFPKAKFADALTIVEKLGHSRRMQVMRHQWIEEGKPRVEIRERSTAGAMETSERASTRENTAVHAPPPDDTQVAGPAPPTPQTPPTNQEHDDDDLYSATPIALRKGLATRNSDETAPEQYRVPAEEDDLDALLAQEGIPATRPRNETDTIVAQDNSVPPEEEEDELDALLAEDAARTAASTNHANALQIVSTSGPPPPPPPADEDIFQDDMDALAELEGPW